MGLERIVLPVALSVALVGGIQVLPVARAQEQPAQSSPTRESITPASELTIEKAEYIMQHFSNEEKIIQWYGLDNLARRVTYNSETGRNNFEELILRSEKPVV